MALFLYVEARSSARACYLRLVHSYVNTRSLRALLFAVALATCPFALAVAQVSPRAASTAVADIDPEIAKVLASTLAIDNHAHAVLPPSVDPNDRNFDALPVDNMEPQTDPVAWRAENPQLRAAWAALWHVDAAPPPDAAAVAKLKAARAAVQQREGAHYSAWVQDQAGIGTTLANRVSMGEGLAAPRFRWVPYVDALLFPLDNSGLAAKTPDRGSFFPLEDKLRARYLHDRGQATLPATLDGYLHQVVTPTLERQRAGGAVAEKFEMAYLRSFAVGDPSQADASAVYSRYVHGGVPEAAAYKLLQDFLFRYIAVECGRLGMPVHLHTMSGGGGYFDIAGGNPMLLEPLFNDPRLRKTRFVMLHGGWPFTHEATALLQKPNVYLDMSQESLTFQPSNQATWLRERLETFPDKVLFGTDGYPYSDAMGWEESVWMAAHNGRTALGLALTGMLRDGEIDQARAARIARMVLRENAEGLYGR